MVAGLIDEIHLFVTPVAVGGGTPVFSRRVHSNLELLSVARFESGVVHLQYGINN
jgi:riboflavin biosynthesis pyrimidine reductase